MCKMSSVLVCALCGCQVGTSGGTNWENIYPLCILLVFIGNCTAMHGVERIDAFFVSTGFIHTSDCSKTQRELNILILTLGNSNAASSW
jgi:hypothetical protein